MATLMPASSNVEAAYEDMFKEITRKLYGEETGNGLHTLGTPVAQVATTGPTAPEGERSFTNLQEIDRRSAPTIEYGQNTASVVTSVVTSTTSSTAQAQAAAAAAAAAAASASSTQSGATNVIIQAPSQQQQQQSQQPENATPTIVPPVSSTLSSFIKSEDEISSAFGLAALMHSGFANTNSILHNQALNKIVTNAAGQQQHHHQHHQSANIPDAHRWNNEAASVSEPQSQQAQVVQWASNNGKIHSYQAHHQPVITTTPKSKSKSRNDQTTPVSDVYTSPTSTGVINLNTSATQQSTPTSVINTPNTSSSGGSSSSSASSSGGSGGGGSRKKQHQPQQTVNGVPIVKRYACLHCPYSTDRRDLYTRHENIHKEEKPFQCYACLKQFNRADHVKKHFLRMHREMEYDINKTRRHVSNTSSVHHSGGRGNATIPAAANVHLDDAFLEAQRQPTSSSLSIAETIEAVAKAADEPLPQLKQEKNDDGSLVSAAHVASTAALLKPKREKRFTCCYCPWSGADKWGLKRHLNTHTKPFVCLLCDYKAARSERLATHVLRVHNKRACNKCSFLADTQEEYQTHLNEVHLLKMDAISRNTASVAQDFHKAGGVQELKIPANHQLLFNNKLPSQWTTREAAALLHSLSNMNNNNIHNYNNNKNNNNNMNNNNDNNHNNSNQNLTIAYQQQQQRSKYQTLYQQQQQHQQQQQLQNGRKRQHSTGEDDENTPSSSASSIASIDDLSPIKLESNKTKESFAKQFVINVDNVEQRRAMTAFLSKNLNLEESSNISSTTSSTSSSTSTPSLATITPVNSSLQQNKRIKEEIFKEDQENQKQLILTSPASKQQQQLQLQQQPTNNKTNRNNSRNANNTNNNNNINNTNHRLDLPPHLYYENNNDKENNLSKQMASVLPPATFLTQLEYQNLNKIGSQFQNYVKDIINKYYAETPLMFPAMPTPTMTPQQSQQQFDSQQNDRKRVLSETEEYIEYLKNKEDITLTITPKVPQNVGNSPPNSSTNTTNTHTTNSHSQSNRINLSGKTISPLKRQQDLSYVKKTSPKKAHLLPPPPPLPSTTVLPMTVNTTPTTTTTPSVNGLNGHNKPRKTLSQIATLLPLLADAACQQQYLAAPLDFSKKSEPKVNKSEPVPLPLTVPVSVPVSIPVPEPIQVQLPEPLPLAQPAPALTSASPSALAPEPEEKKTIFISSPEKPLALTPPKDKLLLNEVKENQKVVLTEVKEIQEVAKEEKPKNLVQRSPPTDNCLKPLNMNSIVTDKRSSRKQAQPKKIKTPPEIVIAMLREKYLLQRKTLKKPYKCFLCQKLHPQQIFHFSTKACLCLHQLWKHSSLKASNYNTNSTKQQHCGKVFKKPHNSGQHLQQSNGKLLDQQN